MAVIVKLKHITDAGAGRQRYRRRFPVGVANEVGEVWFKEELDNSSDAALLRTWTKADAGFAKAVKDSKARSALAARRGPRDLAEEFKRQADALLLGARASSTFDDDGNELISEEDEARALLAESLASSGADPRLYAAVVRPDAPPPAATLRDAVNEYLQHKLGNLGGHAEKKETQRVERVFGRVAKALGPLDKLALVDLRHKHGRAAVASYLQETTATGKPLTISSIRREMNIVKAVVNYGLIAFDLENEAKNPFAKVTIERKGEAAPVSEAELREALPGTLISGMITRLPAEDHRLIWRLLVGTGCRLAEITGLTVDDIELAENIPHIRVRWNENRRLKTVVSIRSVPLVGDALEAAREAMRLPREGTALFPRYGREGGPGAASQAIMGYLRELTDNRKHVIHSLRHNMRSRLERTKAVPENIMNLILGHKLGGTGARVYGDDRLHLTQEALTAAMKLPPR